MDLEQALKQFDAVDANFQRFEKVWIELRQLVPDDPEPVADSLDGRRYDELLRAYKEILTGLPPIGECRIKSVPEDFSGTVSRSVGASMSARTCQTPFQI